MKKIRVLMQNRPKAFWTGGDMIKLEKISEELTKLGVDVTFNDHPLFSPALLLQTYDIVHTWNFSMEWTKYQVWAAVRHKRKLVCSMIYHETDRFIPYDNQQIMLDALDAAVYETETEIERVKRHMTVNPEKTFIIPNGIDPWWFTKETGKVPVKNYILTVGRIEPGKGQLTVAAVAKRLGMQYVCIGETIDQHYYNSVRALGATIYPSMDHAELKKWYKNCQVYIQPSTGETWGMAVDEAGTQGVPIVISTGFERSNIPDVIYCAHGDNDSIKDGILKAVAQKKNIAFRDQLKKRTWKLVAEEYLKIYKEILK